MTMNSVEQEMNSIIDQIGLRYPSFTITATFSKIDSLREIFEIIGLKSGSLMMLQSCRADDHVV